MANRTERLIRIYNRLRRGPVTVPIILSWSKTAGISVGERQLYRDLNELKSLQFSPGENVIEYVDEKNRKTWKLEYSEGNEQISQYDINSFFLLKNFAPYAVYEHRKSSIEKFEKILYKSFSKSKYQQLSEANELYLRRTNYFENLYGEIEHNKIEDVLWALQNKKIIEITHDLLNCSNLDLKENQFPLTIFPLELVFHGGRVHLGGLTVKNSQFVLFAIDKTLSFRLTNEKFNRKSYIKIYNDNFDKLFGIAAPRTNRIYTIKLEFTESYGNSVRNFFFHHSQKWSQLDNGNYMLELRSTLGREIFGFLGLSLDKIKVHQPKILKEILVKKMRQMADINEKNLELNEAVANADY